jgi:hypothetical protein
MEHRYKRPANFEDDIDFIDRSKRLERDVGLMDDVEKKDAVVDGFGSAKVEEDSFFDLVRTFASLEFPEAQNGPEQCPLCPLKFSVEDFAPHVYECLKKLDDVERAAQVQLDEKYACRLADEEAQVTQFEPSVFCPYAGSCKRSDAQHFMNLRHPQVPCPVCDEPCEVYEVNAHINFCLERGGSRAPSSSAPGSAMMSDYGSAPRPPGGPAIPVKSREEHRGSADRDSDDETLDSAAEGESAAPSLTKGQMKAMANMVVQQRAKVASDQDCSLMDLLSTFKQLGFTKENLGAELRRVNSEQDTAAEAAEGPAAAVQPDQSL